MNAAQHIKRRDALKALRLPREYIWREAYDFTYPDRGALIGQEGAHSEHRIEDSRVKKGKIFDSTAADAARLLAANLQDGMTPSSSRWVGFKVNNMKAPNINEWLDSAADTLWQNIHASNYDAIAYEAFLDVVIAGMFALYVTKAREGSGKLYNFKQWPLHSIVCTDSTGDGFIDTVYRSFTLTAEQAVNEYGKDEVGENITKVYLTKPDQKFDFIQAIYPKIGEELKQSKEGLKLPIASVHIQVKGKHKRILRESGFEEMPVIVPRWMAIPDSSYAFGPVDAALADIKTLNEIVKGDLAAQELSLYGMWGAVDDGVLNPKMVKVGPRKVIPVMSKDSFFPLPTGTDFKATFLEIDRLQRSIRKLLMADQLQPQDGPAMTATEVHIRMQLIRQILGPMYGRFQVELLEPMLNRCFGIALRAGVFADVPAELKDKNIMPTYSSPLAKAQKLQDVGAMDRFEASLLGNAQSGVEGAVEAIDVYDYDKASRTKADLLGVPAELLRDTDELAKFRIKRQEKLRAQIEAERKQELVAGTLPKVAGEAVKKASAEDITGAVEGAA